MLVFGSGKGHFFFFPPSPGPMTWGVLGLHGRLLVVVAWTSQAVDQV